MFRRQGFGLRIFHASKFGVLLAGTLCQGLGCKPRAVTHGGESTIATKQQLDAGLPEMDILGCPKLKANGTAPLIDDFENARQITTFEDRAGQWFFYNDGTTGEQDVQRISDGSTVMQIDSSGFASWGSGFGMPLSSGSTLARLCPYDVSAYSGLSFRAKGVGRVRVRVAMRENTPIDEGGDCTLQGEECYDWPGTWLNLDAEWATYHLPFCALVPEGWSHSPIPFDATRFGAIHFQLTGHVSMTLDDLQFSKEPKEDGGGCALPCPLESVSRESILDPAKSPLTLTESLSLHTFEQPTLRCGLLTRRYISYVPQTLVTPSSTPVLVALHGSGAAAESFRDLMTHGQLDALAERDGIIVVYGNAAPGAYTDPSVPNSGAWRQDYFDDEQVDDVAYLSLVLSDMRERGVITGSNPIYLTGISNGAGMVLKAAKTAPSMFAGIAPFMPFDGFTPELVPKLQDTGLSKVLFGYAPDDPGVPANYGRIVSKLPNDWGIALGLSSEVLRSPETTELPNVVVEGDSYTGDNAVALATRNSRVVQFDFTDPVVDAKQRVLVFERAGHFWPTPVPDTEAWIVERWGFRNQDLDASIVVWDFFFKD